MKFDKKYISGKFPFVVGVAFCTAVGIIGFMIKTMVADKEKWEEIRTKNFEKDSLEVKPVRGNILSDDGQLMASSLPDYKVYIDFMSGLSLDAVKYSQFSHQDSIIYNQKDSLFLGLGDFYARELDSICNGLEKICPKKNAKQYKEHLAKGWKEHRRYYEICQGQLLDYIQFNDLLKLPFFKEYKKHKYLIGLNIDERNNRKKPFGSLARRTLGDMFGAKDSARSGLELAYDSILRGESGISHRRKVLNKYIDIIDKKPVNGSDIVSTIDITMQDICENALREELALLDADMGVVVLMEVKTGDVKTTETSMKHVILPWLHLWSQVLRSKQLHCWLHSTTE